MRKKTFIKTIIALKPVTALPLGNVSNRQTDRQIDRHTRIRARRETETSSLVNTYCNLRHFELN